MSKLSFYLSTGEKNGFYTLHRVFNETRVDGETGESYEVCRDIYVQNLSTEWGQAVEKARKLASGRGPVYGTEDRWELTPFSRGHALWQFNLDNYDGRLPYGKLGYAKIEDLNWEDHGSYLEWFACWLLSKDRGNAKNYKGFCSAIHILLHFSDEIEAAEEARAQKKREQEEAKRPVVEGRIVIEGKVVKTDVIYNHWGSRHVITVADDRGFLVWGSEPSGLNCERGDIVRFTGTVTKSDRDESFGFFKRPAKSEIVVSIEEERACA